MNSDESRLETDLIDSFSEVVRNLLNDTNTLRGLSSLHITLQPNEDEIECDKKDSLDARQKMIQRQKQRQNEIKKYLHNINETLSSLEQRIHVITDHLKKEKEYMKELSVIKAAAIRQMQAINNFENEMRSKEANSAPVHDSPDTKHVESVEVTECQDNSNLKPTKMKPKEKNFNPEYTINLPLITQREYDIFSKNACTNSKISLVMLNEAIMNITNVCQLKYSILHHYHNACTNSTMMNKHSRRTSTASGRHSSPQNISTIMTTIARTKPSTTRQYQEKVILEHFELELNDQNTSSHKKTYMNSHNGRPWISEECLRDSCSFFRLGEVTSRSIISSLRSLGRLQQVNNKSRITYVLLTDNAETIY